MNMVITVGMEDILAETAVVMVEEEKDEEGMQLRVSSV
jgi:hypothetical protein